MQIAMWASTGINAEKVKEIYKESLISKFFPLFLVLFSR